MKKFSQRTLDLSPSKTVAIDTEAKKLKAEGIDVINLSAGEPSETAPDFIRDAAIQAVENGESKYTSPSGLPELKKCVCRKLSKENKLDYKPEQIVISSGAKQSVFNTIFSLINPGDEVIIPSPYWVTYPELVKLAGGIPIIINTEWDSGFKIGRHDLKKAITPATKLLIINSPSNPAGSVYSSRELEELAHAVVDNDIYCLSDEIYEYITYDLNIHTSIASLGSEIYDRTIVINGVSKSFAIPGWRLGYSACIGALSGQMTALQSQCTLHPSNISQFAAIAAMNSDNKFPYEMAKSLQAKRNLISDALDKIPDIQYVLPSGAFYFFINISAYLGKKIESLEIKNSSDLCGYLLSNFQVAVVPGASFGMDKFIRISFTAPEIRLNEGMERLKTGLRSLNL